MEELALSIRDVGVFEPLLVTRRGRKRFIVIAGHRRLEAAKRAGLDAVLCVVLDLSDGEFLHYSLIENLQRANLEPFEEAAAIKQLIELTGFTYREVAAKLGKSAAFVSERLAYWNCRRMSRRRFWRDGFRRARRLNGGRFRSSGCDGNCWSAARKATSSSSRN